MSDTRFTLAGIVLVFVGFVVLGIFGSGYVAGTIESQEFGDCFEYSEDKPPVKVDCNTGLFNKSLLSGIVIGLVAAGIVCLIRGIRGSWDQNTKPQDMVGPGGAADDSG